MNYDFTVPACRQIRYIVHTDCKNEADDQNTLAHILMTPKMAVQGIVACHFDRMNFHGMAPGTTMQASYDEIIKVMDLMHLSGAYPVLKGAPTFMKDEKTPVDSEGARFIIREAMKEDERPLFIGMQGALTDLASAILMEPEICKRMTAIWIGGGDYPKGGNEFNLSQDVCAANVVFRSDMELWQVPMSTYKQFGVTLAELQMKVKPHGKIGEYLFRQLVELNDRLGVQMAGGPWPHGELWGLGDEGVVAAVMEELEKADGYSMIPAPEVDRETMEYIHTGKNRPIRVYHSMNARLDLEDFFCKLAINFPNQDD